MNPFLASCQLGTLAIEGPFDAVLGLLISLSIEGIDGSGETLDPTLRNQLHCWCTQAQGQKVFLLSSQGIQIPEDFKPAIHLLATLLNAKLSSADRRLLEFELEVLRRRQRQVEELFAELEAAV